MRIFPSLCLALLVWWQPAYAAAKDREPCATPRALDEKQFVPIGGIEQWVTIKGASCANPVILVVHGGPGNPMSPYADSLYGAWGKQFTLVQWDQRGAGLTWGRNRPKDGEALTLERMAQDGTELAAWLAAHLGKKKIILFGGSWGSVLGVHMAKSRPDLFYAYLGTGQMVGYRQNQGSYAQVLALASAAGDQKTVSALAALGPPPWTNPRNPGILRRATRAYEAKTAIAPPASWWVPAPEYATAKVEADFEQSEEYSWLQFVGWKGDGIYSRIDLPKLGTRFDIPVFLVQGSEDLVTLPEPARRYFDSISAPQKEFVMVPRTGHDPNVPMLEAQYKILTERILPLAK